MIDVINAEGSLLAIVVRKNFTPDSTQFVTQSVAVQQVGLIVYPAGEEIAAHYHPPAQRMIHGTPETLIIRSGLVDADIYDPDGQLIRTVRLEEGDVLILVAGGHGFRMSADSVILEVKQGPYLGADDKRRI